MDLGFITNSLADLGIKDFDILAKWAYENKFKFLEVGPSVELDEQKFTKALTEYDVKISAFIYCRNFLSSDEEEANLYRTALIDRMRMAKKLGVKKIICSTGISKYSFSTGNPAKFDPLASVEPVAELFKRFAEEAEKNDVKICYENCPLMGNIAISPYMWDILFEKIGSDKVGLVFDPSHLVWQFIDPYSIVTDYNDRIFHVHGKDCQIDFKSLSRIGVLHNFSDEKEFISSPHGSDKTLWWRYRLPGLGDLDWNKIVSLLYEIDYQGQISIEHEDPVWGGNEEKVKKGLIRAKNHIESFL